MEKRLLRCMRVGVICLLSVLSIRAWSQDSEDDVIDSLTRSQKDSAKLNAVLILSETIKECNAAIRKDPTNSGNYTKRGFAFLLIENYPAALKDFHEAISKTNNEASNAQNYNYCGITRKSMGDFKGALKDYDKAIKLDPFLFVAYRNRSLVKKELGESLGSESDLKTAVELEEKFMVAYYQRGIERSKTGDYKGALLDFDKVVELNPLLPGVYLNRGYAKAGLGDKDGACNDFKRASALGLEGSSELAKKNCD